MLVVTSAQCCLLEITFFAFARPGICPKWWSSFWPAIHPARLRHLEVPGDGVAMAARASWKGYLRLSLVSVPVQAFTASASGHGKIQLHQIHEECHSRIKYKKTCPIHGEVSNDEIVSGYEYAKGQYVIIDPDELDKLRTESDKAIQISTFVEP